MYNLHTLKTKTRGPISVHPVCTCMYSIIHTVPAVRMVQHFRQKVSMRNIPPVCRRPLDSVCIVCTIHTIVEAQYLGEVTTTPRIANYF